jgi:hypothetical protein
MTRVIVDSATRARLANARAAVELCDEAGNVLGQFIPVGEGSLTGPLVDVDELNRRERLGGGRPLPDILADLGSST